MNCNDYPLVLDKRTMEELYAFLYRSEKQLSPSLIDLMDIMEKECFSHYSLDEMKELTSEGIC